MKIIVPMAGRGSRLRPHTLTVPKPLVPVGGKPIVHRLVEDIAKTSTEKIVLPTSRWTGKQMEWPTQRSPNRKGGLDNN